MLKNQLFKFYVSNKISIAENKCFYTSPAGKIQGEKVNYFNKYRGKIIVYEGSDGTGKTTQSELLKSYLESLGLPVYLTGFPQYTKTSGGMCLARLLRKEDILKDCSTISDFTLPSESIMPIIEMLKEKGIVVNVNQFINRDKFKAYDFLLKLFEPFKAKESSDNFPFPHYIHPKEIDPLIVSIPYAIDRTEASEELRKHLEKGEIVILNRYWTSNLGHQVAKYNVFKDGKLDVEATRKARIEFIRTLFDIEIKYLQIPIESVVVALSVSHEKSQELLRKRGSVIDAVESDESYLMNSANNYKWLSSLFKHWLLIECQNEKGELKNPEEILKATIEKLINYEFVDPAREYSRVLDSNLFF